MENSNKTPMVVYTTESQIRHPIQLLHAMWDDLRASRELSWSLFVRDISAQYRQSILGVFWAFVPPIITGLIFIVLQSRNLIDLGETDIPYPVFVLVGTILWQVFTESLNAPLKSLTSAIPMLGKINFPREALILSSFYTVLFNLSIKMIVVLAVLFVFRVPLTWGFLLAPIAILMLILLGMSIGLLLSPMGMLYLDISVALTVATQLLFFVTPVVYSPPTTFPDSLIATLNPISPLLIAARDLITKGVIENPNAFIIISILTIFGLFISLVIYRISMPIIIERISA